MNMIKLFGYVLIVSLSIFYNPLQGAEERLLLITGCARSGTSFISKLLIKCGLDIQHELIGTDGSSSWPMATHDKDVPWGDSRADVCFSHVFHQVRHPLDVISSVYVNRPQKSWDFVQLHVTEIHQEDSRMVKCAKYWYYWNIMAEKEAEWTYRLENLINVWDEFQERLGRALDRNILEGMPQDVNHRLPGVKLTWNTLKQEIGEDLFLKIRDLAERYGYPITDEK